LFKGSSKIDEAAKTLLLKVTERLQYHREIATKSIEPFEVELAVYPAVRLPLYSRTQ